MRKTILFPLMTILIAFSILMCARQFYPGLTILDTITTAFALGSVSWFAYAMGTNAFSK